MHTLADTKTVAKAASVNLLGILARSSRTLVTLFVTRVSGAQVFGLFTLVTAVVELVTRFTVFGLDKSLLKFVPEVRGEGSADLDGVLSAAFRTALVLGLIATVGLVWGAPWISEHWLRQPDLGVPLRLAALAVLPLTFVTLLLTATKALKIMSYDALVTGALMPALLLLFAVPILWTDDDVATLALAFTGAAVASVAVSAWFYRKHFAISASLLTRPGSALGRIIRFSTPLGLHDFVQFLAVKLEIFILAFFVLPADLGVYALAAELAFVTKKFRQIFDPILIPLMSEARSQMQMRRVEENVARVVRWILTLGVLYVGGMVLFPEPILTIFGSEFGTGAGVLVMLCVAQLVNSATGLLDMAMMVSGRPRINLLNVCLVLATQTGLNLWLVPRFGLLGASTAALATFVLVSVVRVAQSLWILRLNPFHINQAKPLVAGVGAGLVVVAARGATSPDAPLAWIAFLAAFVGLYGAILWLLRVEKEDKHLLKAVVRKR